MSEQAQMQVDYVPLLKALGFYALIRPSWIYFFLYQRQLEKVFEILLKLLPVQMLSSSLIYGVKVCTKLLIYYKMFTLMNLGIPLVRMTVLFASKDCFELLGLRARASVLSGVLMGVESVILYGTTWRTVV